MARLAPLDRKDLPKLEPIFQLVEASMGFVPNSMFIMARKPGLVEAFAGLGLVAMQGESLPEGLGRLVAYMASHSSGCQYCQAHTHHQAARDGLPNAKLDDIWNYERNDLFTEAERAALRLAQSAGLAPNEVTDGDFVELRKHFTETQIVEIVAIIAFFGFLNRWNDTFATPLESGPLDHALSHLADHGWTGGNHR